MKKIICFFIFILFLGCSQSTNMFLGVGQALDSESPNISITSPENGVYVNKSDITITGMCSDNVGVTRIRGEAGINETASVVTEEIKFSSVRERSWSVTFDKNDLDRILNLWRSGLKVTFTFTCYDAAGNTTVEHLFLYVDVEQPTVIINRPEIRFTEDEKNRYEKDVESFKKDYDINKFEKVNSFVNKEFILKGYVDDDYSVKSTYINIYNATKKKQVGVTPVIFKDGTFIAGGSGGAHGGVTGNSQSWEFKLDSTLFCPTEGWHVLEVVTEDEAGNEKRQFVDKDWIYINQAADIPKNNFTSFDPGFKLNAGNMIAGNGFDDDGMKEVWIKIVPESKADPETPYTEWKECNEAEYIVKKCADFAAGGQLGNWSLKIPSKAGNYIIYAVPVDIYGVAPQVPYEGIYTSYFSVASEEDPVVGIDGQFRGATIVDEEKITGFFYDNEKVTKITAKMKFDEQQEEEAVVLYDSSKQENVITIDKTEDFSLMTGQVVVKHFFTWNFKTSDYSAFKVLQMTLKVEDNDDNYGEDAVTIYGDSERPVFVGEITPANNSNVKANNVFEGTVSDNVGVVKVIIKNENNSNGWECTVSTPVKTADGKYENTFKYDNVYPNDFGGYIDSEFTVTAIDAAGNEANHIIFLKGDKNKAQIEFYNENGEKQESGNYVTKDKTFDIRITPHHFGDGTYRKISQVVYSIGKTEILWDKTLRYSNGYYSIPLKVETLISDLGANYSGDVTLQIKAIDETNNDSQGTLYFIVDNEAPNGLSITSPMLKDEAFITGLIDVAADINENDLSYYQNQEMILKGTISDNYRINEAVLDFYNAEGTSKIHSVTLTYDKDGKLSVSGDKSIITAYSGIPGNFTLKIDTTKFADGNYLLKTTAYDAAGNSTVWGDEEDVELEDYYFKVLQEADRPRIIFNMDFDSEGKTLVFPGTTLKGAVVDDDAVAESGVKYICTTNKLDNKEGEFKNSHNSLIKTFTDIKSFTRQDWQLPFPNTGTYYLYMQAKDRYGKYSSEIYERVIIVSSSDKPSITIHEATTGTGGAKDEDSGYYSGNINIVVTADGGEKGLKDIQFRITSKTVSKVDDVTTDAPDKPFELDSSANLNLGNPADDDLGKWHNFTFTNYESPKTVTLSLDSTLFASEATDTITVEVRCFNTDNLESTIVKEKIAIDNEAPTLKIASPVKDASVNKKFDIQGSANDKGAGVEAVYVSYQTEPTVPTKLAEIKTKLAEIKNNLAENPTLDKWYKLPEDKIDGISWSADFNSEIIHKKASEHSYNFTVAAVDMLGNITFTQQPIKINQDLDRPIVRLQNLNLSTGGTILHKSGFIYGTVSDDDGGNDIEIYVSENGVLEANDKKWGKNLYSNGSWEYTFNGDGKKKLAFKVVDSIETTFISADNSGLTVPKIIDSTGDKKTDSIFTITVDTESPEMTEVYFNAEPNTEPNFPTSKDVDTSVWSNSFSEKTFGGTEKKIWFLIGGTDENGIKGCTLTATDQNSGVDIPDTNDTNRIKRELINGTYFYKYEIGISKVTLTSLNFKIVMEDNSGLTTQKSFTVNIDNTAPTVSITSHSDGNNVYGTESNTIKGIVGEKDSTVEYALTGVKNGSVVEPSAGDYIEIGNSSNWEIVFKDNDILNNKIKNLYNVTGKFEDSYDLYVWLKATDKYGNVSDEPTKVKLVVLANGDKPKVSIDYPLNPTAGEKPNVLGGRITIYGSTEIATSSVKEVYIQIDTNYNGTFASDWVDKLGNNAPSEDLKNKVVTAVGSIKGIPVTSSSKTNWRLNINENKTMSSGLVAIKAIAVSETGKYTESEIVVFTIDENVPQFSDLKLVQYKDGVAVKTLGYEDDMWISGEGWKLECVIEDDIGIDSGTITTNNTSSYPVNEKYSLNDGRYGYKVKIPLRTRTSTSTGTSEFGRHQFKLEANDTSDPPAYNSQSFVLNYDNKVPDFGVKELSDASNDRTKIENYSSGVYPIKGTFNEDSADGYNQSGFERIAMYFTRTVDDTTTYVIDPMLKKGAAGESNRYDVDDKKEKLTSSDGMYWREAEVSTINDDKITLSSSVPNNVRKGGLVKVSGAIYRINDISGQQIVVAGTPDTEATKVYFAIAQVIDNTIQENGVTTYYDESNSINFDDDDKMVEGVSKVGTTYEWSVSINSENIFDGDVDVHFVAFDKAGNVTPLNCYGRVSNNAPRIAGVSFGTDDNGNNEVAGNEYIKNYANSYVAGADGRELGVNTNGKLDTTPITNLKLPIENFDSASPLMTVKGETSLNVKVVGGNTKLQWQWQIGSGNNWSGPITLANSSSFNDDIREQSVIITTYDFVSYFKNNKIEKDFNNTTLNIKIVDGTENGGQEAKIAIKVKTALLDTTPPLVKIDDFYWNSESENSLYDNSRANGHIELAKDLPTDDIFKESTGIYDTDPKVSGKITIKGTASDNVLLKALYVTIKDSENTNNFKGGSEFKIAERDENGNWIAYGNMDNDGWACEIFDEQFTIDGNTIKWKFHWDAEKLSTVAATDVNVQVRAEDRGTASISGNKVVYAPKSCIQTRRMDVVPYITDVKRNTMYSTVRAGSGAYPLLREEKGNVIKGFNISGSNPTLSIATDKNGSNPAAMSDVKFSNGEILFTVPGTAKDGYLHLTVNGIPALNNMNKRDASYNSEASAESKYWTDDRYVRIWQDTDRFGNDDTATNANMTQVVLAKNIVWPAMSMSEDGTLYASFTNYGMHNVYYTTVGGTSRKIFHANDSPEETTILVSGNGSNAKVNVAYMANNQSGGHYYSWTPYTGDAGGFYLYDPVYDDSYDESNLDEYDGEHSHFELLYHDRLFQQFKNFRIARGKVDSQFVHAAYYDIDTMSIHYSNIYLSDIYSNDNKISDSSFESRWVNIDGGFDEHDTIYNVNGMKYYKGSNGTTSDYLYTDGKTNLILGVNATNNTVSSLLEDIKNNSNYGSNDYKNKYKKIIEPDPADITYEYHNKQFENLSRCSATGEYVGIDVTIGNEYPVIAYFDSANRIIRLARANHKCPKSSLKNNGGADSWKVQRVITDTNDENYTTANGNYINLQIDSKGYVHIVFVNGRGELVYVKSTNNPNDGKTAYTFGPSEVIAKNSPMNVSMTIKGTTPYIGYLTSLGSFDGLNTAFWDGDIWETMSAPLVHTVANNRACVEAHPNPASSAWESAHAYYSVGYYRVAYYIGNGGGH